jgi:hypothetical protein
MKRERSSQWRMGTLFLLLLCTWTAVAQTQFATIYGRVSDKTGAVMNDATVTLTNTDTQTSQTMRTSNEGTYILANVAPGNYLLAVQKESFSKSQKKLTVTVADRLTQDFTLEVGGSQTTVTVEGNTVQVNTTTGEVAHTIEARELQNMPLLTKNPYALIGLAAGVSDTASGNGDARGQGFAVNGQRTSSLNFLLDGAENNETFITGPAVLVPNDSVQELKLQGSNMTAEFGRNAAVTNVVTKSGTNQFHGTASEYYRGAALTANTVQNKANGVSKPNFVRNDFTFAGGGPIIKDKTFFYGALEGVRVRSSGNNFWWVPTQQFLDNAAPNMVQYFQAGGLPPASTSNVITSLQFRDLNSVDANGDGVIDDSERIPALVNPNTGTVIGDDVPLFGQVVSSAPIDAGGGTAQNTWNALGKIDHHFTSNTQLGFRFAFTDNKFPTGFNDSPYPEFRTPNFFTSANYTATLTHTFSPNLVSESRLTFSRTEPETPNGTGSPLIPCIQFANRNATLDGNPIVFPGYIPTICNIGSVRSGGPQNTISAGTGFTMSHGKHTFKWGGYFSHLRDNHTFAAFENGNGTIADPQNLLNGIVDTRFSVAIDPKGKVPGDTYDPAVDGPFQAPNFTRHYRYNEVAFYGEDAIRLTNRFTLTLGMRWEYFGVLHSPNAERALDANFVLDAVGQPKSLNPSKTVFEQIRDGRFQRVNNLFNQDWNNFGPRVGFAWDVFGNGRTAVRGGYGMFFDKNFGNALFNAIQNPPNYNVAALGGVNAAVDVNEYVLLTNIVGPGAAPMGGSARMLQQDMVTAYNQQWNVTVEHDILGKGLIASASYVGTKGDKLYALNNLNQLGSCILAPPGTLDTCDATGSTKLSRLNQTGVTGLNRRGNEGFSRYNSLQAELKTRPIHGLMLDTSYTLAHWKDNVSSFFGDSTFDGNFGFGFRDPFNPGLDYADSSNDVRHRFVLAYSWEIPIGRQLTGIGKQIVAGWSLSGVYSAQTGGAFSVYDASGAFESQCSNSGTNYCYPLDGPTPKAHAVWAGPNAFNYYDLSGYKPQNTNCQTGDPDNPVDLACTAQVYLLEPNSLARRNVLRLPGIWNFDAALAKKFSIGERAGLEFHLEALNIFNHSNFYGNPTTNDIVNNNFQVTRGVLPLAPGTFPAQGTVVERRALQLGAKITF